MSSSRAGGGSGSAAIPANARKTVQSLKEIVPNSEDEIYAVLKECNMDPNETVQRLLNQDPFHEVKRKRDKKKEWNKEVIDIKARPASGAQTRGGRGGILERGSGRGGSLPRHGSSDFSGVRGKSSVARENGSVNTNSRAANPSGGPLLSAAQSYGQGKTYLSGLSSHSGPVTAATSSSGLQNGSPAFARPSAVPQGSWVAATSSLATMADIVKANGTSLLPSGLTPALSSNSVGAPISTSVSQHFVNSVTAALPISSGIYSSSTDPVLHPSIDPRATGTSGAIKREIGTVGNQRSKGDCSSSSLTMDSLSASSITSPSLQTAPINNGSPVAVACLERDTEVNRPITPPGSASPPVLQVVAHSHSADDSNSVGAHARHETRISSSGASGSKTPIVGGPFGSRPVYLLQQHPVGTQKVTGAGLEWKPKLVVQTSGSMGAIKAPSLSDAVRPSSPSSVSGESGILSAASCKLQGVSIHDDQPVIIPNHLQVADAEQTHLSFGSFAAGFGMSFSTSFVSKDGKKATISINESTTAIETPIGLSSTSSAVKTIPAAPSQSYAHQSISVPDEVLAVSSGSAAVSLPPTVLQSDLPKPDLVAHQGPHYPYLPAIPSYPGFNVMQQVPVGQYTYETSESQPPDVTRLASLVPYTDPAASYYTPLFRPGSDGDARYPPFVTSNASSKYNGNIGLVNLAGQNPPSQESGNTVLPAVPAVQTSQTGNGQTVPTVPQQPLPLHAYPSQPGGAPLGHHFANVFGYQYIPPSYAYMHTHPPYQHNYATNSVYPQAPTGSTYPTAAASTYPPGGATTVKYQLPPYKPGNPIAPHSAAAAGYGGYSSAPGYVANPSATSGSTSGYDDVGVQQYKDNIYIPSQQVEGSTVWIQAQLSRDMAVGGMQTSSYYNMPGQGQHGAYAHAQQPAHAHSHPGAYASLYHPSQSGQAPTPHQLLQQPQALGTGGGSQAGGYQQPQRTQQMWTNNY